MLDRNNGTHWQSKKVGDLELCYYLREPSPNHWNAVGIVCVAERTEFLARRSKLIVGVGDSPAAAVQDLVLRVSGGPNPSLAEQVRRDRRPERTSARSTVTAPELVDAP